MYPIRIIASFEKTVDDIVARRSILISMKFEHRKHTEQMLHNACSD